MNAYLTSSQFIDWKTPSVLEKAQSLATNLSGLERIAEACFLFVRDEIKHSADFKLNPVTCAASDVLKHGTGYCFAKSHLLAALLRANDIPAGLCYQRLTIKNDAPPFCLHGLNAIFLQDHGWYRADARGNKKGVMADFCPPVEKLAFPLIAEGEFDISGIFAEPLMPVVNVLNGYDTYREVLNHLPDVEHNH